MLVRNWSYLQKGNFRKIHFDTLTLIFDRSIFTKISKGDFNYRPKHTLKSRPLFSKNTYTAIDRLKNLKY